MSNSGLEDDVRRFFSSRFAIPVGLILTTIFCIFLLYMETGGTLCFGTLVIAISAYAIPRYFGMRDLKRLLIWGFLFLFIITGVAVMFTDSFYSSGQMQSVSSEDGKLLNASVSPYSLNQSGIYGFSVIVTDSEYDEIILKLGSVESVYLGYITGVPINDYPMSIDLNYSGAGTLYFIDLPLESGDNYFFVVTGSILGSVKSHTPISPWPTLIDGANSGIFYFMGNLYYLSLNVGLPYFVLTSFSWWIRRNMDLTIAKMREEGRIPPLETVCPNCNHPNPTAGKICQQCGEELPIFQPIAARVQASKKEVFMCSECGIDVDEDATVCPNCGEPFDE